MTDEIRVQVVQTIAKIETAQSTQLEIDQLWSEIKNMFVQELNKIPNLPTSSNKKQNRLFRKSQPFWNTDLEELWKSTCQMEKSFTSFKVRSNGDQQMKSQLRSEFKNAQKLFDRRFRDARLPIIGQLNQVD